MKFHITSYDVHAFPPGDILLPDGNVYQLPTTLLHQHRRYNYVLVAEMAQYLHACGYEVTGESIAPPDRDEHYISSFISDGITTRGVYNSDVVCIREVDSDTFCLIDMQDYPTFGREWSASPKCLAVYMTMYERDWVYQHTKAPEKYRPFGYFTMYPDETVAYADALPALPAETATDLRLFFAGTIGSSETYSYSYTNESGERRPWREVGLYLYDLAPEEVVMWDRHQKLDREDWWKLASQHRWNLFLAGGPWCNREHELWTLGCATIGFTYPRHPLMVPLIPDLHYAAVDAPGGTDNVGRPRDPKAAAAALLARYRELRDNQSAAVTIAKNAQSRMRAAAPHRLIRQLFDEVWGITSHNTK